VPKRKPNIVEQLKKAREKQAQAMERFALAQAHFAQVEARLKGLQEQTLQPPPDSSPQEQATPSTAPVEITQE
jgi:hypothetical protein